MDKLTHMDERGRVKMVNVSSKPEQLRKAEAKGFITLNKASLKLIQENKIKKGNVCTIAQVAGIQAAKQTAGLIPLCHPLKITNIHVQVKPITDGITVKSSVTAIGPTGVEMEALTAVSVALLTVYDMCKAVDKNMRIGQIELIKKIKNNIYV